MQDSAAVNLNSSTDQTAVTLCKLVTSALRVQGESGNTQTEMFWSTETALTTKHLQGDSLRTNGTVQASRQNYTAHLHVQLDCVTKTQIT